MFEYMINIFRNPALFLGFFTMIGLILQGKSFSDIIKGSLKTIIGIVILFQGVTIIIQSITPLSDSINLIFSTNQQNTLANFSDFIQKYSIEIGIVMITSFLLNILIAYTTTFKVIFLTANFIFWFAMLFISLGVELQLPPLTTILLATLFTTLYLVIPSNLLYPYVKELTGTPDFSLGHSTSIFCFIGIFIGKIINAPHQSAEQIKLPKQLLFFTDTTLTSGFVIFLTYFTVSIIDIINANNIIVNMFNTNDIFIYSLNQGTLFSAGTIVLLLGSRMMLTEIIPSFQGISSKLVPNSIPALDVPMIFSFGMNSLIIGFLVSVVSSLATIVVLGLSGLLTYAIIPLIIACYFDVAPGAIFANKYGGIRAVILSSALNGILLMVFCAFSLKLIANTSGTFIQTYGGNDFSVWLLIANPIFKLFQ
ncbi:MAG: PTS transporter subunit IIC [Brevinema sp.]